MSRNILPVIAFLVAFSACASGPKVADHTDPWRVNKKEFRKQTRVIALANVNLPDGLQDPEPIQDNYTTLIESKLRKKGYTVVRPQENRAMWDRAITGLGATQDSLDNDPQLLAQAMTRALEEANVSPHAVLVPTVKVVEAQFKAGRAKWDGATQSVKAGSAVKNFWAGSPEGTLGALSLYITLFGPDGKLYYENAGGIEVLSKVEGKEFVLVPRQELFTDQDRNKDAVNIALDPLF